MSACSTCGVPEFQEHAPDCTALSAAPAPAHRHKIEHTAVGATTCHPDGRYVTRYTDHCACGAIMSYSSRTDAEGFIWMEFGDWIGGLLESRSLTMTTARPDGFDQRQIDAAKAALLAPAKPRCAPARR